MKVPAEDSTMNEASREGLVIFRLARGVLFGIGGFDGNASLAVLAESLDEELSAGRIAKREGPNLTSDDPNESGPH